MTFPHPFLRVQPVRLFVVRALFGRTRRSTRCQLALRDQRSWPSGRGVLPLALVGHVELRQDLEERSPVRLVQRLGLSDRTTRCGTSACGRTT